jgi:hypothetical protein
VACPCSETSFLPDSCARLARCATSGGTRYPDFGFKPEEIKVLIETPEQVFAEYTAHTKAARAGCVLHHLFAGRLVARKGKITLVRESLNTVAAAQALNPNGVADLPPPESEIFSVPPNYPG